MKYIRFQKRCRWLAFFGLMLICIFFYSLLMSSIPDKIRIVAGREESFDLKVPVTGQVQENDIAVFTNQSPNVNQSQIHINMNDTFTLKSSDEGEFSIHCKLFGIFDLKDVTVEVINEKMVIPCGTPVGIYVKTDGILAIGTGSVTGIDGMNYEPALHIIQSGDYIKTVNDSPVSGKEELVEMVNESEGESLVLGVMRGEEFIRLKITPVQTGEEEYKLGIWVRDDLAGVGTITYYTADMEYGALGHPVSDIDTGSQIRLGEGMLYETKVVGITKGEKGNPGELAGVIDYLPVHFLGSITGNMQSGIFGTLERIPQGLEGASAVEIALKQEGKIGKAQVLCNVSGERKEYEIEILSFNYDSDSKNKGIQFRVTDERLLQLTGGIVQGMSGSPIMQNGKLLGAVTHVLVNDPTKGYGIFIENMLEHLSGVARTK